MLISISGLSNAQNPGNEAAFIFPQSANQPLVYKGNKTAKDSLFQVFVLNEQTGKMGKLPLQGIYEADKTTLSFMPAFGFAEGVTYSIKTNLSTTKLTFKIPVSALSATAPIVKNIYPSANEVPQNIIRFYISFSQPMQRQVSSKFIKLIDNKGNDVSIIFMSFSQELWSADGKNLTLILDPRNIKQGVNSTNDSSAALTKGHTYRLQVAKGWPSESGIAITSNFIKLFTVQEPQIKAINKKSWRLTRPHAFSRNKVIIHFDRPLDYFLSANRLHVFDTKGNLIQGNAYVNNNEQEWHFIPKENWKTGKYKILVNPDLEDMCGNRIGEALDHEAGAQNASSTLIEIPFTIQKSR